MKKMMLISLMYLGFTARVFASTYEHTVDKSPQVLERALLLAIPCGLFLGGIVAGWVILMGWLIKYLGFFGVCLSIALTSVALVSLAVIRP